MARASACTCTSRSARRAATTATSPRGPTGRTSSTTYVAACVRDVERRGLAAGRRACSSAAARRRSSPRAQLTAHPRRHPARRRRRGHGRVQPRLGRRRASCAPTRDAGVNRVSFGVQSMRPHVLVALGRTHDPDNVARAVELRHATRASSRLQPRPHLRHAGRVASPTGRRPSTPRSRSSPGT